MTQATGNPRTLHRLLGVLVLASALSVRADSVTLTLGPTPASAVTNGTLVPITVTAITNGAPNLVATSLTFRTLAPLCTNTWNTLPLTPGDSPTNFLAIIPRLPTGKVEFAASCTYVDSSTLLTSTVVSATTNYTVGAVLENIRNQTFERGFWNNSGNPLYNASDSVTGWTGTLMQVVATTDRTPSLNSSAYCARFRNASGAAIVSPILATGIGAIYFEAGLRIATVSLPAMAQTIVVQISTNDGAGWTDLRSYTLTPAGVIGDSDVRASIPVNLRRPARLRIYQATSCAGGAQSVYVDNIQISHPPVDVLLSEPANPVSPVDPVTNDTVTILCSVQDHSTNAPSINRRMKLFYAWTATNGAAASTNSLIMTNSPALPDQYSAVIPALGAGTNRYYYRCEFDGYYSTNSERRGPYYLSTSGQTSTNVIPPTTNQFSYAINASNVRAMRLLPAGGLGFGLVVTNATTTNTLLVCNDGNASLNITNILSDSPCFAASPTSFAVAAQRTQSVSVVFQPLTNGPYVATLTVLSDKTTGANTCALTGTGANPEEVTTPSLSGATSGTLAQMLSFTATNASNNWGYSLQYQFTSSDGWTSGWSASTSASNAWSALGTKQVYVQARSATNPAVRSALSTPFSVLITNTARINLGGVANFGIVGLNFSNNLVLQISNAGPGVLTISNITITNSIFTSLTTSLSVLPNTSSNVLIQFAPVAPGVFTDIVVVASDATSGTNTWRVIGTGEKVFAPSILPTNTVNTLYLTNTFTTTTTNSTGEALNYQFDWGDDTALIWSTNVASGASFVTNHAWQRLAEPGAVTVRARCATHTNSISDWSAPVTVTITNAYVIGVSPALLDFKALSTNQTTALTLALTNIGNGTFNVESLSFPSSAFSSAAFPPIQLAPGAGALVTLTFAPLTTGWYGGTITVNADQALGGTRTVQVTGLCEVVDAPVCTNAFRVGHVNEAQSFGFTSASTSGEALQYFYDWGDGTTNSWTNSAALAHAWSATNDYALRVRARCQAHTNIVSSWSATNLVRIYAAPLFAFSPQTNGQPFQVTMTATGAAPATVSNCVFYFLPPLSTYAQSTNMALVIGNDWSASIPALSAGTMGYYLQYMRAGVPLRYPALTNQSMAITNALNSVRFMSFESATWNNSGNPLYNASDSVTGWTGTLMQVVATTDRTPSLNSSAYCARFRNASGAAIVSPILATGIGAIYFEAGLRIATVSLPAMAQTIVVQISTNDGAGWTDLRSYTLTPAGVIGDSDVRASIPVNLRRPARLRIYQAAACAGGTQFVYVDNIIISPPPTDVQITEVFKNPGYPNCKDPVRVRCQTADYTNLVTGAVDAPSVNRRLSVYYKHDSMSSFVASNMVATGANSYEGEIPTSAVGAMQYYFQCDFDGYYYSNNIYAGTALANLYPSEKISPAYLPDPRADSVLASYPVPTTANALNYTIRPFRSEHESVWIQCTPTNAARKMDLVDDYTWQGTTLITGIPNLTWYYQGYAPYSNNATALGTVATWGDNNQYPYHYPPLSGDAELGASSALQAELVYSGLLLHRFTTTAGSYLVRKGVYQTFDDWPARPDNFEDSLGIHGVQLFTEYFTDWASESYPANGATNMNFTEASSAGYSTPTVIGDYLAWGAVCATQVVERGALATANRAMLLNNSPLAPGCVWNTSKGVTEGLRALNLRARLTQNDGRYALYTKDLAALDFTTNDWVKSYRLTNTFYAASMSPDYASLSTLFCYRRDPANAMDFGTFYELRLTQQTESTMRMQLFRWKNGVIEAAIPNANTYADANGVLTDPVPLQMELFWTNVAAEVHFAGGVTRAGAPLFTLSTNTWRDTTPGCLTNGGVVGFLCKDAEMVVSSLEVYRGTNVDVGARFSEAGFVPSSWYLGYTTAKPACWSIANGLLSRPVTTSYLGIDTIRTGTTGTRDPDFTPWLATTQYGVSSFSYTTITYAPNFWDQVYVRTRFASGELPIVVDDLSLAPWRAYTRGFDRNQDATLAGVKFWDWTTARQQYDWSQSDTGWLLFEAMVTRESTNPCVALQASRANTNLSQGVWSLLLTNGLGSIAFRATVTAGTSRYLVEATNPDSLEEWWTVESFSNNVGDGAVNRFVPVRLPELTGRIRIVQLPTVTTNGFWTGEGSSPDAILTLDNLTVRDYPPTDDGTWRAYNCLIASPSTNNQTISRSYEGTNLVDHRTCYLNNSPTNGVLSPGNLSESNPYLQSPKVDTGIGQIAFYYRAWDATPAQLSIQAAPSEAGPWTVLTNFTVTSTNYACFDSGTTSYAPNDPIVRIYVPNALATPATTGRLCIDNVMVAEAVRPRYTIADVQLLPAQPLATNEVGVRVTIDRKVMDPQGIRLFLSYVTGTSNWGYRNWWGTGSAPTAGVPYVELTCISAPNVTPQVFASTNSAFIPPKNIDEVVQYVVWGTCANWTNYPIFQEANTFTNPSWYSPVDLNRDFAAQGWSPYYYVYSCPPGSVWVNEINYNDYNEGDYGNEYVEVVGPNNAKLGKWQIDLLYNDGMTCYDGCTVSNSVFLPNDINGWGFFVWGDETVAHVDHTFAEPKELNISAIGGVRLVRSMGAWEDLVCWGSSYLSGRDPPFRYAYDKSDINPLYLAGLIGSNKYNFAWYSWDGYCTPGEPNPGQSFADMLPIGLCYYLTSVFGSHGAHSLPSSRVSLAAGSTTSVTYTADEWYRIQSFATDGAANAAAVDSKQFVWAVTNMQQNYSNSVSFYPLPEGLNTNSAPVWWLAGFGRTESAPFFGLSDGYSVSKEYLLNMNPYVSNAPHRFTVEALAVTGSTVNVTVQLLESTDAVVYYAQPYINGTLYLMGTTNLNGGSWSSVASQAPTSVFDANGRKVFSFPAQTNRFYKAYIQ